MADPEKHDLIFKASPTPSLVLLPDSPKFTIIKANDAYLKVTQLTAEALVGRGFFEVFSSDPYVSSKDWVNLLEKLVYDKLPNKTPVIQYNIPVQNASKVLVKHLVSSNTPVFNEHNELEFILRTITDVTDITETRLNEKIINANLVNNEKFLSETQRIAKVGSWEADMINKVVVWSDTAREMHEVTTGNHISFEAISQFYNKGANWEKLTSDIRKAVQLHEVFDHEVLITTAKGNSRWIRLTGIAEIGEDKQIRLYGAMQDVNDRKVIEEQLIDSKNQFEALIQTVDGIVWECSAETYEFTFISKQVESILGFSPEQWMGEPYFWENHLYTEDRPFALDYCSAQAKLGRTYDFDYRMVHADGSLVWIRDVVSVITENGKPILLRGVMLDITDTKRFTELERLEKRILELNALKDSSIHEVLAMYLQGIEHIFPKMICSILHVRNNRIYNWLSPSLPKGYIDSIEGLEIGNNSGSCGTAAFRKEKVIASDIENDLVWVGYKHLALPYNLLACWSLPVIDSEGTVMATFGIYYHEVKMPEEEELKTIDRFTAILKIILENRRNSKLLEENTFLMKQGQELAHFGNWQWDIAHDTVTWSDSLYAIFGLQKEGFKATFAGYRELLHPDDRESVFNIIQGVLHNRQDVVFEERIIRPTGEMRRLKSWGRLKTDENGIPVKMIGACLDITESKKIQDELVESESRLKGLVDALKLSNERYEYVNKATKDAIYDWDMARDHIAWGDGFSRLFGYQITDEKFPVAKMLSLIHPLDLEATKRSLTLGLINRTQHNWRAEYQLRKADNYYTFVQENGYILRNADGEAIRMIGVLRDVTQRKKTQLKLLKKSGLLAAIAEVNSNLLLYNNWFEALDKSFPLVGEAVGADKAYYYENHTDTKTGMRFCQQRLEWMAGGFEPVTDHSQLQYISHELIPEMVMLLHENKPFIFVVSKLPESDFKAGLITNRIKSLMVFPVFVKNKFYGFIGFNDCTRERKWDKDEISFLQTISVNLARAIESEDAEKALLTSFDEKNKTLESIRDGFFAVSKDWTVTYWNKEAENLTGINREEIVGNSIWKTYYDTIPSGFHSQYLKALDENIPVRFEEYLPTLEKWFEVNAFPAGNGLTVYFKNITERKLTEAKLAELHNELEKHLKVLAVSNAELEQFAYVASHDLQEPLRMVTGFLTLLDKKYGDTLDEKARVYIGFAVDGAKRMRQIILDLLDFSRVGKTEEKLEVIDLNEVVSEILTLYQKTIKEKRAKIEFPEMPVINAFRSPLRQVFQNLISNGLKYQPKGQNPLIRITSEECESYWQFSVKDNGIGIDQQYLEKIFIIFQRLHNRDEFSGTGMGLAITRKIVENLGGKIWVESEEGKGSTFYFSIAKKQVVTL